MQSKDFFERQLNSEQQQVVAPHSGVLIVTAGAGSGKTRVITARIAHLMLEHRVDASKIIALTFTNKAAKEMKERISGFLGEGAITPTVGTFHSYCLRTLKSNSHLIGLQKFSLLDEQDQDKIARTLIADKNLTKKLRPRQLLSYISRIKNEATNDQERAALWGDDLMLRELFHLYEARKDAAHCLDFDDLLLKTLELYRAHPAFKQAFQQHVRHILIDEYQDTNIVQHALLKLMTLNDEGFALDSLCVVGDEDQSIYSWRGATVSNIINFHKDYPGATSITVERNYRSVQPILHIANEVIKHNSFRNPKKLYSEEHANDPIRQLVCASGFQEGQVIALLFKQLQLSGSLSSHAILYRSHVQSRSLEEALIRHSIPYKIMGGIQFYDRLEIKDIIGYLRLLTNPLDRLAFGRIINKPAKGLGDKFEELVYTTWDIMAFEPFQVILQELVAQGKLTATKKAAVESFLYIFEGLSSDDLPSKVLEHLLKRTGYYSYLDTSYEKDEATAKKENIKELMNGMLFFEERNEQPTVESFLEEVSLLQEQMNAAEDTADYVKLMTLHAAKGLEFNTVVLAGLEESILPSSRSLYAQEDLEEERRLLYVGITRARKRLLLTRAKYRYTYGQLTDQLASRFLDEIPPSHAPSDDASHWKEYQAAAYFQNWLTGAPRSAPHPEPVDDISYEPAFVDDEDAPTWRRAQKVLHKTFGQGVIEKVEQKSSGAHLTIRFRAGIKKLDASFVKPLNS